MFEKEKKERLSELYLPDKSPKGSVDEGVINLLEAINGLNDYYTMSSCSGRTSISKVKDFGKGLDWLFVSHNKIDFKEIEKIISNLPEGIIYFRYEGLILHVCAKDRESANKLMLLGQNNGCKYSSVISMNKRWIVEFIDMIRLDVPIAKEGKLLVSKEYLKMLIEESNKKLILTHSLIKKLEEKIKGIKK
jgi:tRNA wybutosine-synthesizing protein 3